MEEEWKDIDGYDDYMISNFGNVWSKKNEKSLKLINHNGNNGMVYKKVDLMKGNIRQQGKLIQVLVANAFILKPTDGKKYEVDHINGNTLDNRLINLRWVTHRENAHNCKQRTDNTSGVKGVCWDKRGSNVRNPNRSKHWRATIYDKEGKVIDKLFFEFNDAVEWRRQKEVEFGYQTRL